MNFDKQYLMGLGGSKHDYAVCLLQDGSVVVAIEEERVTGAKRGFGCDISNSRAIEYCLTTAGINLQQIAEVWANDLLEPEMYANLGNLPVFLPGHHLTHAASAFYPSQFSEAAVLVADHSGGRFVDESSGECVAETMSYYYAQNTHIDLLHRVCGGDENLIRVPWHTDLRGSRGIDTVKRPRNSLGRFYARVANVCKCVSRMGDGKLHTESGMLMGMAAFGDDRYYKELRQFVAIGPNGGLGVEMGGPDSGVEAFCNDVLSRHSDPESKQAFRDRASLAYAAQKLLEESLIECARHLWQMTRCENLALAGGVFLNAIANHRILKETPFKRIFVQPAAHDAGTALGAAYLGWYRNKTSRTLPTRSPSPFLGRIYD
ncbi:carbamoyltransferase N-terminal domain-containing protein, partial [Labrenzia sp. DG1229]|uniref:carbamoyltransferase N-terminal domain-containing protein n=1 Tax=Labrenzia sp. DG1229 TaxID=681847 RepID=UPI0004907A39